MKKCRDSSLSLGIGQMVVICLGGYYEWGKKGAPLTYKDYKCLFEDEEDGGFEQTLKWEVFILRQSLQRIPPSQFQPLLVFQYLQPSEILTTITEPEGHITLNVFGDHDQNTAADASAGRTLKPQNCSDYSLEQSRRAGSVVASWSSVCNHSEEQVPLRNTPRLLQLMTAGGSQREAVWQHLLRY